MYKIIYYTCIIIINYYELASSPCTHLPGEDDACSPRPAARAGI